VRWSKAEWVGLDYLVAPDRLGELVGALGLAIYVVEVRLAIWGLLAHWDVVEYPDVVVRWGVSVGWVAQVAAARDQFLVPSQG
jgi:hypothetical protein